MMKKIVAFVCVAGFCVSSFANIIPISSIKKNQDLEWMIYGPMGFSFPNDTNHNKKMAFIVHNYFNDEGKKHKSDSVTLLCNGYKIHMYPEIWMICDTKPGKAAGLEIGMYYFKNGAGGLYKILD